VVATQVSHYPYCRALCVFHIVALTSDETHDSSSSNVQRTIRTLIVSNMRDVPFRFVLLVFISTELL
jgi:hypothetical protein